MFSRVFLMSSFIFYFTIHLCLYFIMIPNEICISIVKIVRSADGLAISYCLDLLTVSTPEDTAMIRLKCYNNITFCGIFSHQHVKYTHT